jgi:hypothetical protein
MLRRRFWVLSALALLTILAFPRERARAHPPRVVVGVGVGVPYYRPHYYYPGPYYYPRPVYGFGVYVAPPPPVYVVPAGPPTVIVQPPPATYPTAPVEPAPALPTPIRP